MAKELPPTFDWVTARQKCSAATVFESMALQAKANVEAMKVVTDGRIRMPFEFVSHDSTSFAVVRVSLSGGSRGVRFHCVAGQEIVVEDHGSQRLLTATLTLNDKGECRLLVDGLELDQWQVLKRVLEPLFFSADR